MGGTAVKVSNRKEMDRNGSSDTEEMIALMFTPMTNLSHTIMSLQCSQECSGEG